VFFCERPGILAWDGPIMPARICLSVEDAVYFKDHGNFFLVSTAGFAPVRFSALKMGFPSRRSGKSCGKT
jgi:hypothetical protein